MMSSTSMETGPAIAKGLCANCNNRPTCVNFRARGYALQCNEHDAIDGQVAYREARQLDAAASYSPGPVPETSDFKGLCVNCDRRLDCRLSNTEIGVWHCEEYK